VKARYEVFVVTKNYCYCASVHRWLWIARLKAWHWSKVSNVTDAWAQARPSWVQP